MTSYADPKQQEYFKAVDDHVLLVQYQYEMSKKGCKCLEIDQWIVEGSEKLKQLWNNLKEQEPK